METEWCFLRERAEIMVNVTGIYGDGIDSVLEQIKGTGYTWTGATFENASLDGEVTEWMFLLGATKPSNGSNSGSRSAGATASGPQTT